MEDSGAKVETTTTMIITPPPMADDTQVCQEEYDGDGQRGIIQRREGEEQGIQVTRHLELLVITPVIRPERRGGNGGIDPKQTEFEFLNERELMSMSAVVHSNQSPFGHFHR